jgi:hypothetical protein
VGRLALTEHYEARREGFSFDEFRQFFIWMRPFITYNEKAYLIGAKADGNSMRFFVLGDAQEIKQF